MKKYYYMVYLSLLGTTSSGLQISIDEFNVDQFLEARQGATLLFWKEISAQQFLDFRERILESVIGD